MAKTKGYRPGERKAKRLMDLAFDADHEFHGAEIVAGMAAPLDFLLSIQGIDDLPPAQQRELLLQWGDSVLTSWNVEDRAGNPVEPNGAGFLAQDADFCMAIIAAWAEGMTQPGRPLGQASKSGDTSAED